MNDKLKINEDFNQAILFTNEAYQKLSKRI